MPTSSGKGERDFIDSIINTTNTRGELEEFLEILLRDTIHEGSSPYLKPQSLRDLGNPN